MKSRAQVEFGDFQTPPTLAEDICQLLQRGGVAPDFVLEPTCGTGAFLMAAAETFPRATLRGYDINSDYVQQAAVALTNAGITVRATVGCQDFFPHDWESELQQLPDRKSVV